MSMNCIFTNMPGTRRLPGLASSTRALSVRVAVLTSGTMAWAVPLKVLTGTTGLWARTFAPELNTSPMLLASQRIYGWTRRTPAAVEESKVETGTVQGAAL